MRVVPLIALIASVAANAAWAAKPCPSDAPPVSAAAESAAEQARTVVDVVFREKEPPTIELCLGGPKKRIRLEEGQKLGIRFECSLLAAIGKGARLRPGSYKAKNLPRGASLDNSTGLFTWQPGLDQAGHYEMSLEVNGRKQDVPVRLEVADRFDAAGNVPIAEPAKYPEENGLPVFHLKVADGAGAQQGYVPATLTYLGKECAVSTKVRGATSRAFPKQSLALKLPKDCEIDGRRKLRLITTFDDVSQIRNRLAFELWNRLDPKVKVAHSNAVVYVNGKYAGVYAVTDQIDEDLMKRAGMKKNGDLYKALGHGAGFWGFGSPGAFEKTNGKAGDFKSLAELLNFVAQATPAEFEAQIGKRLDLADYRAWLTLVFAINARDTLGKNTYHYKDPETGVFHALPTDFNESFGQTWRTHRVPAQGGITSLVGSNGLFKRLWEDPVLGPETHAAFRKALAGPMSRENVLKLLDQLAEEVASNAARDERRWSAAHQSFGRWSDRVDFQDFSGEIRYMRRWIQDRWDYLNQRVKD